MDWLGDDNMVWFGDRIVWLWRLASLSPCFLLDGISQMLWFMNVELFMSNEQLLMISLLSEIFLSFDSFFSSTSSI